MSIKVALLVTPEATTERLEFTNETSLKVFQAAVDGLIQPVTIDKNLELYVNEEGIYKGLKRNVFASLVASEAYNLPPEQEYTLLGNAVFFGGVDAEGHTEGLPEETFVMLEMMVNLARLQMQLNAVED